MLVTEQMMREASTTGRGHGYTKRQIEYAQQFYPGKWRRKMVGSNIPEERWTKFLSLGNKKNKKKVSKILNTVSARSDGWNWKPKPDDIPAMKVKGKKGKKSKRCRVSKYDNAAFYNSREWKELRARVLERYECKCMMCGRSPKMHGVVIHVDHIKPRSKYPHLSLVFENLQLLCEDCNLGKSNKYETDYRPTEDDIDEFLDEQLLKSSPF